ASWRPLRRGLASNTYFAQLRVDPASSHVFGVGPSGFSLSVDHARTWANKRGARAGLVRSARSLPGAALVGLDDGIWRTEGEGVSWTKATGYPAGRPHAMGFDPNNAQIVYAGNQRQLYSSADAGKSFASVGAQQALTIVGLHPDPAVS